MLLHIVQGAPPIGTAGGHCYACHSLRPDGYLRTYIDIASEGEIVLCLPCAGMVAAAIGWVPADAVAGLKAQVLDSEQARKDLALKAAAYDLFSTTMKGLQSDPQPEGPAEGGRAVPGPEAVSPRPARPPVRPKAGR